MTIVSRVEGITYMVIYTLALCYRVGGSSQLYVNVMLACYRQQSVASNVTSRCQRNYYLLP